MSKFKVGDRVVYAKGTPEQDTGVITQKYGDNSLRWWVKWDSDGEELHLDEDNMELENAGALPLVIVINGVKYKRVNE